MAYLLVSVTRVPATHCCRFPDVSAIASHRVDGNKHKLRSHDKRGAEKYSQKRDVSPHRGTKIVDAQIPGRYA